MTTENNSIRLTDAEVRRFDNQISQEFAELRVISLKIRATAIAAIQALGGPISNDPDSLVEIIIDYAEELNTRLDKVENGLRDFAAEGN